jgi:DNA-binding transcriptional MerR regulator
MIEKIKYMIELYNLTTSCRDRDLVYKRAYIYSELRKLGMNLSEIGRLMDKHHATIINGLKVDNQFQNCDKIYDDIIAPIKDYLYPGDAPIELPKYSIFEDVIKCNNTTDLRIIKERIANDQYLERDK